MGLKLHGEVALDGSGFERGLHKIQHSATHVFKEMAVTAFGIYGVEQAIEKTISTAEELINTSKRLDTTVEELQLIRQAAKDSGTELSAVAGAIEKINIAREKVRRGDKDSAKLLADFKALGVTPAMLKNQTSGSLLLGPISAAAKSKNVGDISLPLREVLGKGFGEILPLLKTDTDELGAKMKQLGIIMDTETAVKLHMMGNELSMLSQILVVQLGPALVSLVRVVLEAIGGIKMMASFLGGITSKTGLKDWLKAITTGNPGDLFKKIFSKDALQAGLKEAAATGGGWKAMLDGMEEKLKEEAEKLKHPTAPQFGPEAGGAAAKKGHAVREGDALVRVGNFLGSAGHVNNTGAQIVRIQERHLNVAVRTHAAIEKLNMKIGMAMLAGSMFPP